MIISKTPFRVSFLGGGSDMNSYYMDEIGAVLSTTINKYMYIAVNPMFEGGVRLSYSKTEEVEDVSKINHPLVRESMLHLGIRSGIEITSLADIPNRGSGLGSSSSYTVGLLNALYAYKGLYVSKSQLAKEACFIEINRCDEKIGKQDQYAASFGGMNLIQFFPDQSVNVNPIIISNNTKNMLENRLMLFYTKKTRSATEILSSQYELLKTKEKKINMRRMVDLAYKMKVDLEMSNVESIGSYLDESWSLKKQLANNITNEEIDNYYNIALKAGASGGKILGAGNGGFLLFIVPENKQLSVKKALDFLKLVDIKFENVGTQILHYNP